MSSGYLILDFEGKAFVYDGETMSDVGDTAKAVEVYNALESNYGKPILLTNLTSQGTRVSVWANLIGMTTTKAFLTFFGGASATAPYMMNVAVDTAAGIKIAGKALQ